MKQALLTCVLMASAWMLSAQITFTLDEDFESYTAGDNLAATSANWEIWPGGASPANDAQVSDVQANSGTNSLYLFSSSTTGGPTDLILPFGGTRSAGSFQLSMMMFVDAGDGGYFNFQADNPAGTTWAVEVFFNAAGEVDLVSDATAVGSGTFTHDTWFNVSWDIDLDANSWVMTIDGVEVANFANNNNRISSMNLYPVYDEGEASYYIDDISIDFVNDFPVYDIATVSNVTDGVLDLFGQEATVTGIVHGIDLQSNDNIQFTLIDATGGMSVFSTDNFGYTVTEGDELQIEAMVGEFNCLGQLEPVSLTVLSSGNNLETPALVTALDESTESELIMIENLSFVDPGEWLTDGSSFNAELTDGTNTYTLRIDSDTDIAGTEIPETPFDLVGIGGQFDNDGACDGGYQILPRYLTDITPMPTSTFEVGNAEQIQVIPNPTNGWVQIKSAIHLEQILVYNLLGEAILSSNRTTELDLSGLSSGVYLLVGQSEKAIYTQQVVVR